jgi:hypothetical protein
MGLSATAAFTKNQDCVVSARRPFIACPFQFAPGDRIPGNGQSLVPEADIPLYPHSAPE